VAFFIEFFFVCFATFVVQNLPARGRKTEKNKEMALVIETHTLLSNSWIRPWITHVIVYISL
jgi:hypothetical protein